MSKVGSKKRTALFLLLITVIILVSLLFINSKTAPGSSLIMEGKKKLAITGEVAAVSNSSSHIYCVKDLFIEAEEENLRVKDISGSVMWSLELPGKIVKLADAGKSIIIIDSHNNINYYSLQGKLLWTYKMDYEIIDIFAEDNGSFMVEYKGMTGSHAEVFTKDGSKIGSILVDNAQVISFSQGDGVFSISILDTSSEVIKTKIITYNFKGDILWAQNFDNIIISKLNYSNNNKLLAVGENTIYIYKNDGSLQEEAVIEGEISNIAVNDYIVAIALHNKGKEYLECYDLDMRKQSHAGIKDAPSGIFLIKDNLILYYKDELLVLTSKGELTARFKSDADISKVYMTSDDKTYILSNRRLQLLEYVK